MFSDTNNRPRTVFILLVSSILWNMGEGMLGPLLMLFSQQIGGDMLSVSSAWSAYLVVTGVCMLIVGRLSNNRQRMLRLMVAGYALNALCTFAYLWVQSPQQLLLVQAGLGLANALATPTWNALYSQFTSEQSTGSLWGIADGQEYLILGAATFIGGWVVSATSFGVLFVLMGCLQSAGVLVVARMLALAQTASEARS